MTKRPALVVIGWLSGNAILMLLLLVAGEWLLAVLLYAASLLPLALFTLAIWRDRRHATGSPDRFSMGGAGGFLPPIAAGITLVGLGFVFGQWLSAIGVLVALICLAAIGRSAARPTAAPATDLVGLPIVRPGDLARRRAAEQGGRATENVARAAVVAVLTGAVLSLLRRRRPGPTGAGRR